MLYSINFHPVWERATRFQFLMTCYIQVEGDGYLVFSTDVPLDKHSRSTFKLQVGKQSDKLNLYQLSVCLCMNMHEINNIKIISYTHTVLTLSANTNLTFMP